MLCMYFCNNWFIVIPCELEQVTVTWLRLLEGAIIVKLFNSQTEMKVVVEMFSLQQLLIS